MAEMNPSNPRKNIPKDLLNDLSSRFIINVPEEERVDLIRLCFQIELAHWFYLDFYCEENPKLPKCTVREFIHIIFRHIPSLKRYSQEIDSVIANWREYKSAVPTYGAILLDQELKNVLLVQSFYSKASWGFPKGKVNEDEKPHHCAIREVYEETGFDISSLINKDEFLEHYFNDQLIRLYIITGIAPDAKFQPQTRKEIKAIEWFPVNKLPTGKKDEASRTKLGPNNFFMVIPFVKQLEKWIASKLSSTSQDKNDQTEKLHHRDKHFLKQQRLFSNLTKKDLAKYTSTEETAENKGSGPNKSQYSPPPRMLRQRNAKQGTENEKRKTQNEHQKDRLFTNSNFMKNFENSEGKKNAVSQENYFGPSLVWKNISLDCEALIKTFNICLSKTSQLEV